MMLIPHPYYLQKGPLDLIETGKGLKVQTDKPHLVSLGSGRLSTAITLLPLEEGESGGVVHLPPPTSLQTFHRVSSVFASPKCEAMLPNPTSVCPLSWPSRTACLLWWIIWLHDWA